MKNISSDDWFEVMGMPKKLTPTEAMWLKVGAEYSFIGKRSNSKMLKANLEDYFLVNYRITPEELKSKTRKRYILEARQIIMHCLRHNTEMSFEMIGNEYNRDHATAIHACKSINNLLETDKVFRIKYVNTLHYIGLSGSATEIINKHEKMKPSKPIVINYRNGNNTTYKSAAEASVHLGISTNKVLKLASGEENHGYYKLSFL